MELKDYIPLAGYIITLCLFWWRLSIDKKIAKTRETIAFLEKRADKLDSFRAYIASAPASSTHPAQLDEPLLKAGFQQLELIAYLVKSKAFDEEVVYQFCWFLYDRPRKNVNINNWFNGLRTTDTSVLSNYYWLEQKWKTRVADESGGYVRRK